MHCTPGVSEGGPDNEFVWVFLRWRLVPAGVQPRGGAAGGPALGLIPQLPSLLTPETPTEAVLCLSLSACSQLLVLL